MYYNVYLPNENEQKENLLMLIKIKDFFFIQLSNLLHSVFFFSFFIIRDKNLG
jgi:hypothetical protein